MSKKLNSQGEEYEAQELEMYKFKWDTFLTEIYDHDQLLIVKYTDGNVLVIDYHTFIDTNEINSTGILCYRAINFNEY